MSDFYRVLKAGKIEFEPMISGTKKEAINSVGVASLNKVILQFEKEFWPENQYTFGFVSKTFGEFPMFVDPKLQMKVREY